MLEDMYKSRAIPELTGNAAITFAEVQKNAEELAASRDYKDVIEHVKALVTRSKN